MAFIPVPNVAAIEIRQLEGLQQVENTLYFLHAGAITPAALQQLVQDMMDFWIANMIPVQSGYVQLLEVYGRSLDNVSGYEETVTPTSATFGAEGGDAMPNNVTICVSFRTGLTGRTSRGRNYWIGLAEGQVTSNLVNGSAIADILDAYTGMVGEEAVSAGWTWVVVSRYLNGSPRVSGSALTVTNVICTDNIVDSQRRRLPGRGR